MSLKPIFESIFNKNLFLHFLYFDVLIVSKRFNCTLPFKVSQIYIVLIKE